MIMLVYWFCYVLLDGLAACFQSVESVMVDFFIIMTYNIVGNFATLFSGCNIHNAVG